MRRISFFILLIFILNKSFAGFQNGNELLTLNSDANNTVRKGIYIGYIEGVIDALGGILICPTSEMNARQASDIVTKYLEKHPENRHLSGDLLIVRAIQEVFPCPNKK